MRTGMLTSPLPGLFTLFRRLLEEHDNLWLDTTMALAEYLPGSCPPLLGTFRQDRVMYGSDFPQLPYAWDRELVKISGLKLAPTTLNRLLAGNAIAFFGIDRQLPRPTGAAPCGPGIRAVLPRPTE